MKQESPSLRDRFHTYVPGFVTNPDLSHKLAENTESYPLVPSPQATWTKALKSESGESMPQIVAHRGYKAKFPENTLLAFKNAITFGAHGLETDVHLTKDNVVVLSHDPSLKRCFGKDELVTDCEWNDIKDLRTLDTPHEPMPRLVDLLKYLSQPEHTDIWLLIDIKLDDDPNLIMRSISEAIASVPPPPSKSWSERIVLGIWAIKYLTPCASYLPKYAVSNIGFSSIYARSFMTPKTPNVSFNMLYWTLMMPISGPRFISNAHMNGREVYAWNVNDEDTMKWCMKHQVDAILTDNVENLVKVQTAWQEGDHQFHIKFQSWAFTIWVWILSSVLGALIRRRLDNRPKRKTT